MLPPALAGQLYKNTSVPHPRTQPDERLLPRSLEVHHAVPQPPVRQPMHLAIRRREASAVLLTELPARVRARTHVAAQADQLVG